MLIRKGIKSYMIKVSDLMKQQKALELMKLYHETDLKNGCRLLVLTGIHLKLTQQMHSVIIVDVEEESVLTLFPIYEFCVQAGVKVNKCIFVQFLYRKYCEKIFLSICSSSFHFPFSFPDSCFGKATGWNF